MTSLLYIVCLLLAGAGLPIAHKISEPETGANETVAAIMGGLFILSVSVVGWLFHSSWWIIAGGVIGALAIVGAVASKRATKQLEITPTLPDAEGLEGPINRSTRLRFEYVDRDGVASVREVKDWVDTRFYIKGVCTSRRATRTFRKDQIETWLAGQETLRHGVLPFGRAGF
jgi:hypothetical protein